ncbi:ATP-grasp domain-containing protein [Bacteroides acidifaciens]|uniref:ATP-grasp domain-containing protein n=1 Tax=Bacteroides acidifaciens TaxID=85831 RepID=UPI0024302DF0|nr:ATP-grasp domain-containing protein [Bacteroides acidifaciens]
MVDLILFPSSFFSAKKVDEDLQSEYDAVSSTGLYDTILFGYDKWFNEDKLVLSETPATMRKAIMRGWMMKPSQYNQFYDRLLANNIELIVAPSEYEQMHIFPNAYKFFGDDTAFMKVYPLHEQIEIRDLKKHFNRFLVKDFVKSVKGTEFPKFFDVSITQEDFDNWMEVFYKYRGNLVTGGICIKEFLSLKFYSERPNEYRVFYANGKIISISKNSGQENFTQEPPIKLVEKYKNLPSIYYTVDFAELMDGTWKVIEAGDGSVSGLSEFQDAKQYFRALYHALNDSKITRKFQLLSN